MKLISQTLEPRSMNTLMVIAGIVGIVGLSVSAAQIAYAGGCSSCCVEADGTRCWFTNADGQTSVAAFCRANGLQSCEVTINSDGSCSASAGCNPAQTEPL